MATIYVVVLLYNKQIIPVGKMYSDLDEARKMRDQLKPEQFPTILQFSANLPPMVAQ